MNISRAQDTSALSRASLEEMMYCLADRSGSVTLWWHYPFYYPRHICTMPHAVDLPSDGSAERYAEIALTIIDSTS